METTEVVVQATLITTILIDFAFFVFVAKKWRDGIIYTLLLTHLVGILGWSIGILFLLQYESAVWAHCAFASPIVLAVAKYYFVISFPENALPPTRWHYAILVPAIVLFGLSLVPGAFFSSFNVVDGYYIESQNGPYAFLYSTFMAFVLLYPIYILARKYRSTFYRPQVKKQLKFLLIGSSVFFIIGLLTNSILPLYFHVYLFNGLGPSFSLVLAGFMIYIVSMYQFLEVRKALQRGFVYSVLSTCILGFYAGALTLIGFFVPHLSVKAMIITAGITTVMGILTAPYIERYLRKKTDRFFFKDRYNYADALYRLSTEINKTLSAEEIEVMTRNTLRDIFKASEVSVQTVENEKAATDFTTIREDKDRVTLAVPIVNDDKLLGMIVLGEKLSGETYTDEDTVLVKTFSYHIAVAFEKAKLFKEVNDYSRELEQRVLDRTAKIHELQESQKDMMLDIAHALQSPLTILKNELSMITSEESLKERMAFFAKTIDEVSLYVYNLLDLARLDTKEVAIEMSDIDVSDMVSELAETYELIMSHKKIRFVSEVAPGVRVNGNKHKLSEVITNLVSNAAKYIGAHRESDAQIALTLKVRDGRAIISVADNGIGIAKDDVPHLFNRFYRTKNTKSVKGTGLGLAISKKIVELHGGTIAVESVEGEGSTFSIEIPLLSAAHRGENNAALT